MDSNFGIIQVLCTIFVGYSAAGLAAIPSRLLALSQTRRRPHVSGQGLITGPTGLRVWMLSFRFLFPHNYPAIYAHIKFCGDYVGTEYSGI